MTKKELSRYFWLQCEIRQQRKRLERLRSKPTGEVVGDTVKDYRTGRGIPVLITGVPAEELTRPMMIALLEDEIQKNVAESEKAATEIERYIQGIEEPKMRELLRSRFLDCLDWNQVGVQNYMNPDHARKIIRNFLKKSTDPIDKHV